MKSSDVTKRFPAIVCTIAVPSTLANHGTKAGLQKAGAEADFPKIAYRHVSALANGPVAASNQLTLRLAS